MPTPFPIDPELQAIVVAYKNNRLIADEILPRVPVGREEFKYYLYSKEEGFTVPDTKVGRRGKVNEAHFSAKEETDSTQGYGLEDAIPQRDIMNAPENYDPMGRSAESLMNLIMLAREVRTAALVFNPNNYAATHKLQLAGSDQWSDQGNSDPIGDIMTALDTPIMRPNMAVIGRAAYTKLAQHPAILKAVNRTAGDTGVAQRQAIAGIFELDDLLVGEGWLNTARKGQQVNIQRVWGKSMSLFYRDMTADTRGGITFGYTAQFGDKVAGQWEDKNIGLHGGTRVRTGEDVKELVTANDMAYFLENVVA